jgi:hypothetical protein
MKPFILSLLLFLQPPNDVEQPVKAPDPKQAIRKILGEASELNKECLAVPNAVPVSCVNALSG